MSLCYCVIGYQAPLHWDTTSYDKSFQYSKWISKSTKYDTFVIKVFNDMWCHKTPRTHLYEENLHLNEIGHHVPRLYFNEIWRHRIYQIQPIMTPQISVSYMIPVCHSNEKWYRMVSLHFESPIQRDMIYKCLLQRDMWSHRTLSIVYFNNVLNQ